MAALRATRQDRGAVELEALDFLSECLAPFEMLLRGFRDSVVQLRSANDVLKARAEELKDANETIKALTRERAAFLAEASRRLSASLDYETVLEVATDVPVPRLADCALVDAVENRQSRRVGAHGGLLTEEGEALAHKLSTQVIASGRCERATIAGRCQLTVVPLLARGRTLGALTLAKAVGEAGLSDDVTVAEDLGRRIGLALDNARLFSEAQQAVRLRDDFVAVAAHELRTPLTPIVLLLQTAIRRLNRGEAITAAPLARTLQMVNRLRGLVSDILDVTRLQEGRLTVTPAPIDLTEIVREEVDLFRTHSDRHRLCFEAPSRPILMLGDRFRLEQVVANLLENAIKYSPSGGEVRILLERSEKEALLIVEDDGIGIPPEDLERVFGRFFRAETAPVRNFGGLGLGLHICKSIVEQHGGRIWAQSLLGGPTRFLVALPLEPRSAHLPVRGRPDDGG
jgi:signal transduction histidine kinase